MDAKLRRWATAQNKKLMKAEDAEAKVIAKKKAAEKALGVATRKTQRIMMAAKERMTPDEYLLWLTW